jgi:hypothetical protein
MMVYRLSLSKENSGKAKALLKGCDIKFYSQYPDPNKKDIHIIQFRSLKNLEKLANLLSARQIDFDVTSLY